MENTLKYRLHTRSFLILILGFFCISDLSQAITPAPRVIVTIKPIQGLVASIMEGVAEPYLLLPDYASPHTFQLKPSNLKALHQADLIIWVGPHLETYMIKPLSELHPKFGTLTISDIPDLQLLPQRHGREWVSPHNNEHDHDEENEIDPHLWLSIDNAKVMVNYIADYLTQVDPLHSFNYHANATALLHALSTLKIQLQTELKPVQNSPYLVYHDGYQYFDKEFHLHGVGTMIINPHMPLSVHGLNEISKLIEDQKVQCVFKETEFNDSTIKQSLQQWPVTVVELDPLGAKVAKGRGAYQAILYAMGKNFRECLDQQPKNTPANKTAPNH